MSTLSLLLVSYLSSVPLLLMKTHKFVIYLWQSIPLGAITSYRCVFLEQQVRFSSVDIVKSLLVVLPSLSWQLESPEEGLRAPLIELRPAFLCV